MKKTLLIIFIVFLCIILFLFAILRNVQAQDREVKKFNIEYEQYIDKEIYGTEIATIINKAVNNNEKYEIEKDQDGFYIDDNMYTIKVEIYISVNDTTYQMETIYNHRTEQFVQNFNSELFKAENVEYHGKTGRIAKILFKQIEK